MMQKLLFLLLTLIALPACSDCGLVSGNYANAGGSEESTSLLLVANKTLILEHGTWQPGQYNNRHIFKLEGMWSCKQNQVTLKIRNEVITGKFIVIGKNPLGINEHVNVLSFGENSGTKASFLSNETLYPKSEISD